MKHYKKIKSLLSITKKSQLYTLIFFSVFASLLELGGVGLFYPYLDFVLNPGHIYTNKVSNFVYNYLGFTNTSSFLFFFGIIAIIIVIISSIVGAYSKILIDRFIWSTNVVLIKLSFQNYLQKSYLELKKLNSNNITNNIISEVSVFINGLMVPIFDAIPRILILILSILSLFLINYKVALIIFFSTFFIYFSIFRFFRARLSLMSKNRFEMQQSLFDYVNSSIRAVKDIKVNNFYDFFIDRVERPAKSYSELNQAISIFSLLPRYILEGLIFSSAMGILLFNQTTGKIFEIIPLLSLYAIAAFRLIPHIQGIFTSFAKIKFNIKALDIVYNNLLNTSNNKHINDYENQFDSFKILNLNFKFEDSKTPLLKDINLTISKNEFIILLGKSGSGKSTFIEIVLGIVKPDQGEFYLNNNILNDVTILSTKLKIGYVSQDVILFEGTLKENILLYNFNGFDSEMLNKSIEVSCLDDVIQSIGGTINGKISEGGKNLSVGQRQRISIARAIYNNPEILFLDEATSALDSTTESSVVLNIKKLGITVVLITHNINLVSQADATYELVNSKLNQKANYFENN